MGIEAAMAILPDDLEPLFLELNGGWLGLSTHDVLVYKGPGVQGNARGVFPHKSPVLSEKGIELRTLVGKEVGMGGVRRRLSP